MSDKLNINFKKTSFDVEIILFFLDGEKKRIMMTKE